jgi:hypothetical protein
MSLTMRLAVAVMSTFHATSPEVSRPLSVSNTIRLVVAMGFAVVSPWIISWSKQRFCYYA